MRRWTVECDGETYDIDDSPAVVSMDGSGTGLVIKRKSDGRQFETQVPFDAAGVPVDKWCEVVREALREAGA